MNYNNLKDNSRVFIVAELSANHNGSKKVAIETIKAAKRAGADAIKLQTYTPDTITLDVKSPIFKLNDTIWKGKYLYDLYNEAFTPWEWHKELFDTAKNEGLICFSSPFDKTAVDFLEQLNCPVYKISSFEITDIPLIEYVATRGKPVIISTGIANTEDIELALESCRRMGNNQIILLKCTSSYPAPLDEANLAMIPFYSKKYDVLSGLSDHTLGTTAPVTAAALGAKVIEKHFILDHSIGGPDAYFSLDENEFLEMVKSVRKVEEAIGSINEEPTEKMIHSRNLSRSLFVVKQIKKGETFTNENIRSIRPGNGLHPKYLQKILGTQANEDLQIGTPMDWKYISS